jgi:60 kDa SS-A/Ro ribonucleoprotein
MASNEVNLIRYCCSSVLNNVFCTEKEPQVNAVLDLCKKVDPELVAKVAILSREQGYRSVPALLCAYLSSVQQNQLLKKVFYRVVDTGAGLQDFVRIVRSGLTGRKSFGTLPKKLISCWFNSRTAEEVFLQSRLNEPSFRDIICLVSPKPLDKNKNALYRWFLGKDYKFEDLPKIIHQYDDFKNNKTKEVPDVPVELLDNLKLNKESLAQIAVRSKLSWFFCNIVNLYRLDVFHIWEMLRIIKERLCDRIEITKSVITPYEALSAYRNIETLSNLTSVVIQQAMEIATENVPSLSGSGYVCIDVGDQMIEKIATSKVRCIDVAGLIATCWLRKNPTSRVLLFENNYEFNPLCSVLYNCNKLQERIGGDVDCNLALLNETKSKGDWVVIISSHYSWINSPVLRGSEQSMQEWDSFKSRNPHAKLICLNLQPYSSTPTQENDDILNFSGYDDYFFKLAKIFIDGELKPQYWLDKVNKVDLFLE